MGGKQGIERLQSWLMPPKPAVSGMVASLEMCLVLGNVEFAPYCPCSHFSAEVTDSFQCSNIIRTPCEVLLSGDGFQSQF